MFKSIALKMSVAVLGILSICFSGVINDALRVNASSDDYSSNAYNMGMFDTVDVAEQKIRRQTGYLNIPDVWTSDIAYLGKASDYHMWCLDDDAFTNVYRDASSNNHGYAYCNPLRFSQALNIPGDFTRPVDYCSFSRDPSQLYRFVIFIYDGNLNSTNKRDLANYLSDGIFMQYKTISVSLSDFVDDINGENAASAWLDGYDNGEDVGESRGYNDGHSAGYSEGYSVGYSDGYSAGVDSFDIPQDIYITRSSSADPFHVTVTSDDGVVVDADITRYQMSASFRRASHMAYEINFRALDSSTYPWFNIRVIIDGVTYLLRNNYLADDFVYLPTWVSQIQIIVEPSSQEVISPFDGLKLDPAQYDYVYIGNTIPIQEAYSEGYDRGFEDGEGSGYLDGYYSGYSDGRSAGNSEGLKEGYNSGYNAGGGGNVEVVDIWPLMGAVVTMPFTFFSQGLDWTLFEGSPYEFGVSVFFGSVLVILMMWKILQLIMGLGK